MTSKLIEKKKLTTILNKKKSKIVLCSGVFDLLHLGHIHHFKEAKLYGDLLVVSLTTDKFVKKGPGRPIFKFDQRAEAISALEDVDYVVESNEPNTVKNISTIKPQVYFKGPDYKSFKDDVTGNIKKEVEILKKHGGKIIFSKSQTFSSSNLINSYFNFFSKEQNIFINKIKKKYNFRDIRSKIDNFKKLNVLILGETIIDEYLFCEALGKSGKEPVLVYNEKYTELYLGGAAAVANNISDFSDNVTLLSYLGEKKTPLDNFILKKLKKNIKFEFIRKKNSVTIRKKRYVDEVNQRKVFGIYDLQDNPVTDKNEAKILDYLKSNLKKFDLVVALDYGHGLINNKIAEFISKNSKFLFLNTQLNASNYSTQRIDKFIQSDCIIINESELRNFIKDSSLKLNEIVTMLMNLTKTKKVIVTAGKRGVFTFNENLKDINCPAFATQVIDKIGSGDSMLSLVSLAMVSGLEDDLSLLIGSLAAADSVGSIGNSKNIKKHEILKSLNYMLK